MKLQNVTIQAIERMQVLGEGEREGIVRTSWDKPDGSWFHDVVLVDPDPEVSRRAV